MMRGVLFEIVPISADTAAELLAVGTPRQSDAATEVERVELPKKAPATRPESD